MISIVIPAYKHANYIGHTISSVLSQSYQDWELIIINDGSPDNTGDVVRPFLADSRIRYLEQENQGQAAARNSGLSIAKGKYIKFLDDDDLLPSDALEWAVNYLEAHPDVDGVIGQAQYIDKEGKTIGPLQGKQGRIDLESVLTSKYPTASPGQALFQTESLRKIGGLNPMLRNVDDFDLMCRLVRSGKVMFEEREALRYRWHEGNASKNNENMYLSSRSIGYQYLKLLPASHFREIEKIFLCNIELNYRMKFKKIDSGGGNLYNKIYIIFHYIFNVDSVLWGTFRWWRAVLFRGFAFIKDKK